MVLLRDVVRCVEVYAKRTSPLKLLSFSICDKFWSGGVATVVQAPLSYFCQRFPPQNVKGRYLGLVEN